MKEINREIRNLIDKYGTDYKRALRENKKLPYLYALAKLRENLLEWYDFREGASLLQVGADYGALTGLYLGRVGNVTVLDESEENLQTVALRYPDAENLTCLCKALEKLGEREELPESPRQETAGRQSAPGSREKEEGPGCGYDYVVMAGALKEPKQRQIQAAQGLLAPGGELIVAVCNRFGLKYWAGADADEVTATKRELMNLLPGGRFYYPMPDYRLPSTIYSEKYLPKKGDLTDTLAVYDYPEYLLMDVGAAYDAVCEDGQFDNFANSFLVIWKKGE